MTVKFKIRNWGNFQHFKDRRPPWIKLHRDILEQRDISVISDRSFRILIGLWLLASEDEAMEGCLPCIEDIAFRLRFSENEINKSIQELDRFIVSEDIKVISTRYQSDSPETETETETDSCDFPDEISEAVSGWNALATELKLPTIQKITKSRRARLRSRLDDAGGLEGWAAALGKIRASPFLRGERGDFRANFDFVLQERSFVKLMEGAYDDNGGGRQNGGQSGGMNAAFDRAAEKIRRDQA